MQIYKGSSLSLFNIEPSAKEENTYFPVFFNDKALYTFSLIYKDPVKPLSTKYELEIDFSEFFLLYDFFL